MVKTTIQRAALATTLTTMVGWAVAGVVFAGCDGCGGGLDAPAPPETAEPAPPATAATAPAPGDEPAPDFDGPPTPTRVTVTNGGSPLRLDVSFGPAAPFGLGTVGRVSGALSLDQPDSPAWPRMCDCPCDPASACPECEAPQPRYVTVGPGADHVFEWEGLVRRHGVDADGEVCFEALPAAPGTYLFSVCAESDGPCAAVEATIPAADGVTLDLGRPMIHASCPVEDDVLSRAASTALDHMARARVPAELRRECRPTAICVEADEVQTRIDPRAEGCVIFVVPRGATLDTVVQTRGTRYTHHLAAGGTRTRGLTYPRTPR